MTSQEFNAGMYADVPEAQYHQRLFGPSESLSSTEAKRILEAPNVFRYYRDNPQPPKTEFDEGSAVHGLVLGVGGQVYVHDWPDLRTKAAREDVAQARENGLVPVARRQFEALETIAEAVKTHPVAGPLFEEGLPEQSIYCQDAEHGVWMRGRLDWITTGQDGRTVLVDLKTARSANPRDFTRQAAQFDYALQREWYRTIWEGIYDDPDPMFLHVVVEKTPPYNVVVCEFNLDFEQIGKLHVERALSIYAQCLESGTWPGYPPIVHRLEAPAWLVNAELDDMPDINIT